MNKLLTRTKDVGNRRVIVDLSWPPTDSVNKHVTLNYDETEFKLTLPNIDDITNRIKQVGPTAVLFKIDIKRAFRNFKIDPVDVHLLGLYWQEKYYVDLSLAFGYVHGTAICQRVTDAVRFICSQHGHWVVNYVDDFIGVDNPDRAMLAYVFLRELLADLGFAISMSKLVSPRIEVTCIGITINVKNSTVSIESEKLNDIYVACKKWKNKKTATKHLLQSLPGKLLYVSRCVIRLTLCQDGSM